MAPSNEDITPDGVVPEVVTPEVVAEVTPVVTETVVPEVIETPDVDFNDFLNTKDAPLLTSEKPKTEAKPEVVVKDEVVEAKPEAKTEVPVKKGLASRDYSGLPAEIVPLFQRMSNEAFDKFKPFYQDAIATKQQLEELKKTSALPSNRVPDSYYEHPDAVTLTQDYAQASTNVRESQAVLEHWREQLDAVRNGATEFVTLQRDPNSKQLVYGQQQKVDQRSQSYLEQLFFNANTQASTFGQKLGEVKQAFSSKHASAMQDIKNFDAERFKFFEDPKNKLQPMVEDTLRKLNPVFRGNPLATTLVKAMISINIMSEHIQKLNKEKDIKSPAARVQVAQKKAGPTATAGVEDTGKKGDDVTFDDFEKVKAE